MKLKVSFIIEYGDEYGDEKHLSACALENVCMAMRSHVSALQLSAMDMLVDQDEVSFKHFNEKAEQWIKVIETAQVEVVKDSQETK